MVSLTVHWSGVAQKWKYLFSFYNAIVWSLMATTLGFIVTMNEGCVVHWRFGWIAMFLAWINFIMYLRRYAGFITSSQELII